MRSHQHHFIFSYKIQYIYKKKIQVKEVFLELTSYILVEFDYNMFGLVELKESRDFYIRVAQSIRLKKFNDLCLRHYIQSQQFRGFQLVQTFYFFLINFWIKEKFVTLSTCNFFLKKKKFYFLNGTSGGFLVLGFKKIFKNDF